MHNVYSRTLLALSADCASDVSAELFSPRSPRHSLSVALAYPFSVPADHPEPAILVVPTFPNYSDTIAASILSSPAWTFQERALSVRTQHLTNNISFWECKSACIGEDMERSTI